MVEYSIFTGTSEAFTDEGRQIIGGCKIDVDLIYYTENVALDPSDGFATIAGSVSGLESRQQCHNRSLKNGEIDTKERIDCQRSNH